MLSQVVTDLMDYYCYCIPSMHTLEGGRGLEMPLKSPFNENLLPEIVIKYMALVWIGYVFLFFHQCPPEVVKGKRVEAIFKRTCDVYVVSHQ